jgi:hypothetical protein
MNKTRIVKLLSLVISSSGLAVMAGWIWDIPVLKSLSPAWISMKFLTAFSFVVSGITLYYLARSLEGAVDAAQVALSITSFVLILLMGLIFFTTIFNLQTGIETLFIRDAAGEKTCITPGKPSVPTMICFILIALAGILSLVNAEKFRFKFKIIGCLISFIGALAIIGYAVDAPLLYYYIEGKNSAIAFHTAGLFVLSGAGLLCL